MTPEEYEDSSLSDLAQKYYEENDFVFENDSIRYELCYAMYGSYSTELSLYMTGFDGDIDYESQEWEAIAKNSEELGKKLVLTADGKEYRPTSYDKSTALPWCDTEGVCFRGEKNAWYVNFNFDSIDLENTQSVTLSDGETVYTIK